MLELITIGVCIFLNAILAASEIAFIAVSRPDLRELAKGGDERALLLLKLRETPEQTLSVIQVGITFVGFLAAVVGGAHTQKILSPWIASKFHLSILLSEISAMGVVVLAMTYLNVVIGELVPKSLALRRPRALALLVAPWIQLVSKLLSPIVGALASSTKQIIHLLPLKHSAHEEPLPLSSQLISSVSGESPGEKGDDAAISLGSGSLSAIHKEYVLNMLKIEKTHIREILIDWSEVTCIDSSQTLDQIEPLIISSGHTRLPVLQGQEVVGLINAKEFLVFHRNGHANWQSLVRKPLSIEQDMPLLLALQMLQSQRAHMAIVYDRGNRVGIVTMEAIFEEIIGDIYDEDDDGLLSSLLLSLNLKKM